MYRIKEDVENSYEIEKSKFITYLHRVFSEAEARAYIQTIQKKHPDASHHCTAFIIGEHQEIQRSNDNGEPSGTAGAPMLETLKKNEMHDIVAVVVRYFGGIKLGAGGLIRAYSKSVSLALNQAILTQSEPVFLYCCTFPYAWIGKVDAYCKKNQIQIEAKNYDLDVTYRLASKKDILAGFQELTSGQYLPEYIETQEREMEVNHFR